MRVAQSAESIVGREWLLGAFSALLVHCVGQLPAALHLPESIWSVSPPGEPTAISSHLFIAAGIRAPLCKQHRGLKETQIKS